MKQILQCPNDNVPDEHNLIMFLAGGISNTANWQQIFLPLIPISWNISIYNPRRDDFDITNPTMSAEQIEWEYERLHNCDLILFWFTPETLCPITLFEYGKALGQNRRVVVGCDPEYARRFDVGHQTALYNQTSPHDPIIVRDNFADLVHDIHQFYVTNRYAQGIGVQQMTPPTGTIYKLIVPEIK